MSLLFRRLVERGWDPKFLQDLFLSSYERIQSKAPSRAELAASLGTAPQTRQSKRLFFHLEHHPCDLPRRQIRKLYEEECEARLESRLGIEEFTVARSYHSLVEKKVSTYITFPVCAWAQVFGTITHLLGPFHRTERFPTVESIVTLSRWLMSEYFIGRICIFWSHLKD